MSSSEGGLGNIWSASVKGVHDWWRHRSSCCTPAPCGGVEDVPALSDTVAFTDWHTAEGSGIDSIGATLSGRSALPGAGPACCQATLELPQDGGDGQELVLLRDMMRRFVQSLLGGRIYTVVVEHGRTESCRLLLMPNLQYLQLEWGGATHDIPLKNVRDICPGKILENQFTPIPLDDLCSTLVLKNNECVTFRFPTVQERDDFTKCVKVLSLALD